MKSLDEVIKAYEYCIDDSYRDCRGCPYGCEDGESGCHYAEEKIDALHYLKELRDMTDIPMEYFESGGTLQNFADTSQIICPKCHSEFVILPEANNALTWSELKQMEGKPIWLEYNFQIGNKEFRDKSKRWCIIMEFKPWHDTEIIITENGFVLSKNDQIKNWQAYRKERS